MILALTTQPISESCAKNATSRKGQNPKRRTKTLTPFGNLSLIGNSPRFEVVKILEVIDAHLTLLLEVNQAFKLEKPKRTFRKPESLPIGGMQITPFRPGAHAEYLLETASFLEAHEDAQYPINYSLEKLTRKLGHPGLDGERRGWRIQQGMHTDCVIFEEDGTWFILGKGQNVAFDLLRD